MSTQGKMNKITVPFIREMKRKGEKIAMITAYDYPTALIVEEAGVDLVLVGDTLGMVVLGYDSTLPVTMDEMIHHTKAVCRAVQRSMVIGDMPFLSYQVSVEDAIVNAGRFLKEAGAQAIKLEGGREVAETARRISAAGIPVMAHLGLTPQSIHQFGGYKVQGREEAAAERICEDALILEEAGAFSLVLECVPSALAKRITASLHIPTIGIGAGVDCDGQVLVFHDLLGMFDRFTPTFVKKYANAKSVMKDAVAQYIGEVKDKTFPDEAHSYR
jgi:3-methyl-2-oxobutanoate hydroxymethyltransferase